MLNLVTGPADHPSAVLIRGVDGIPGPGRLTKRLRIGRALNNLPATPASGLHLEDHGVVVTPRRIKSGPRIGVDYAGEIWAAKPWRFQYEYPGKSVLNAEGAKSAEKRPARKRNSPRPSRPPR